ncbi:TetR/AcrR family transcriptional regulator [Phenylobacterium sp.]|uniref:TetR/AcrR family transcriptional regulator n=1 Tax=Phenylobacterium sp. TaxID=1871053 RepID=UPI002CE3DF54|nr:TetR/AcrR family transcriptional regulator [Phenylobacterium sp.]HLZ74776.1 TetR/AcrR family transcriptional regulator [Phenylobacterium sp.]
MAREVFFEEGFSAATMSTIAARLGGSKATLYAYFKNKEDLFDAIIADQCSVIESMLMLEAEGADIHATLTALGRELVTAMCSDQAVRTFQLIIEESRRNPELARRFDQAGPKVGSERLGGYLATCHAKGDICAPDPVHAAGVFFNLMKGELHFRRLLGLEPEPSAETVEKEVATAVATFLRAYAPR